MAKRTNKKDEPFIDANENLRGDGHGGEVIRKKKLISGAKFWDFDENPVFIGTLLPGVVVRERDSPDGTQKAGSVMGYNFVTRDGEAVVIGNSHAIEKAVSQIEAGDAIEIIFMGKETSGTGKPFNRFEINVVEFPE